MSGSYANSFGLVGLMPHSTIFESYLDGATASWVLSQYYGVLMCLAQGHNTVPQQGSNPRPLDLKSDTLPQGHCAESGTKLKFLLSLL